LESFGKKIVFKKGDFLSGIRIFFQDPEQKIIFFKTNFIFKTFQNLKFIMQSGPCQWKLLIVFFFYIVFSEFILQPELKIRISPMKERSGL
jgi:hypothetical protein